MKKIINISIVIIMLISLTLVALGKMNISLFWLILLLGFIYSKWGQNYF